jgi:hypothetical protein
MVPFAAGVSHEAAPLAVRERLISPMRMLFPRMAHAVRANAERSFQMAEAKWPVCTEEAKANVHRPWPCTDDTADRPLRPGRLPGNSERMPWERAGARMGRRGPIPSGVSGCVASAGQGLVPPRRTRDPSALPPFRKFISAFALMVRRPRHPSTTPGSSANSDIRR